MGLSQYILPITFIRTIYFRIYMITYMCLLHLDILSSAGSVHLDSHLILNTEPRRKINSYIANKI